MLGACAVAALLAAGPAAADRPVHTYSIVARDATTGEMGVAVQSHWFSVGSVVTWAAAGVGAVATQAFVDPGYGPRALALLGSGLDAQNVLQGLLVADAQRDVRQVAIVDARGGVVAHTGAHAIAAAGHLVGDQYAVQANLMTSDRVWPAMAEAFERTRGDLAERMLAALAAAQEAGGDIRGRQSAALLVVRGESTGRPWVGGDRLFDLRIEDSPDPIGELTRLVRLQRAYNHANRGDELFAEREVEAALSEYAAAGELAPEIEELPFWQAVTLVSIGREADAMPIFRAVFARNPVWADLVPRLPAAGLLPDDAPLVRRIVEQRE